MEDLKELRSILRDIDAAAMLDDARKFLRERIERLEAKLDADRDKLVKLRDEIERIKQRIRNSKKRARKKRARDARALANECPVCLSREADVILHGDERHKICAGCSKALSGGLCPLCRHRL